VAEPLAGKRVIVTAGASGIGQVVAKACTAAGAKVAVCDVDRAALERTRKSDPAITAFHCDVAKPDSVESFFRDALGVLGGLDILVNNAGTAGPTGGVDTIAPADWDAAIAVNLSAQFYCARLAVPPLRAAGGGSIVNMSSVAGRLGFPNRTPYAAAKWGVIGFTQSLAMELGPEGIRVNAILPGPVVGERMERVLRDRAAQRGVDIAHVRAEEIQSVSLRTMIDPQEIADLIVFICSDKGRSISGQSLGICGNMETLR